MSDPHPTPEEPRSDRRDERADVERFTAFVVGPPPLPAIVPAAARREWMDRTMARFANRCLPLLMANQSGWWVLNAEAVRLEWTGEPHRGAVRIESLSGAPVVHVSSQFGYGIVTWTLPYLFRTPSGFDLLVRGPANLPKHGIVPLEGLVETDWAVATFTMSWQLTQPGVPVTFEEGEPFCMLVPQRRLDLESLEPSITNIELRPELRTEHEAWLADRQLQEILRAAAVKLAGPQHRDAQDWSGDYVRGVTGSGQAAREHRTKRALKPFEAAEADQSGPSS